MAPKSTPSPAQVAQIVKQLCAAPECPPYILIVCPDEVRRIRILNRILSSFLQPGTAVGDSQNISLQQVGPSNGTRESLAVVKVDGSEFNANQLKALSEELSSLSLFSKKRFFYLTQAQEIPIELARELSALIKNASSEDKFLVTATKLPSSHPFSKLAEAQKTLLLLEELQGAELSRWVEKEFSRHQLILSDPEITATLIEIGEHNPDRIAKCIEQLSLYCGKNQLTLSILHEIFPLNVSAGEFEFLDALTQGQSARAEIVLKNLLEGGKNPFLLLSLLSRSYAQYLTIRGLLSQGAPSAQIQKTLAVAPWVFQKSLRAVKNYSLPQLSSCVQMILRADSKLKNRNLGSEAIFGELIHHLSAHTKKAA